MKVFIKNSRAFIENEDGDLLSLPPSFWPLIEVGNARLLHAAEADDVEGYCKCVPTKYHPEGEVFQGEVKITWTEGWPPENSNDRIHIDT